MTCTTTGRRTGPPPARRRRAGRGGRPSDPSAILAELDALASELGAMWSSALEAGDFEEITRLGEASHAIHLAVVALLPDGLVPASRVSCDPAE